MSVFDFLRLIYRNLKFLILVPVIMGVAVYFLTANSVKEYKSSALIYTGIASGFNIESGSSDKVDYHAVNAAYDNLIAIIKSRFTLQEVGIRLLSLHLMQNEPGLVIGKKAFADLNEVLPMHKRSDFVETLNYEKTVENIRFLFNENHPVIRKLITGTSSYGAERLSKVEVKRVKSSDMIEIAYKTYDPGVCKSTLDILTSVFIEKYKTVKRAETGDVVTYFMEELAKAKANLQQAEQELTDFRVESRVINYGEETKALAIKKQNALEEFAILKMNKKATEAALLELEKKLEDRQILLAQNLSLIDTKKELQRLTSEIAVAQNKDSDSEQLTSLMVRQNAIKKEISQSLGNIVKLTTTKDGVSSKQLINQWIENIIRLNREVVNVDLYEKRLSDIDSQYDNFTPMGSNIDRLERQINVYEREYLEVLHGLNMSKLRQQNIEISSNLATIDKASYPYDPEPSKRLLFVIASFLFGGFGTLSIIIAKELLDNTLKNPETATEKTGLQVAAAYPVLNHEFHKTCDAVLLRQVNGMLISSLQNSESKEPNLYIFTATESKTGTARIASLIQEELIKRDRKTLLLLPTGSYQGESKNVISYDSDLLLNESISLQELSSKLDISLSFEFILLVTPALNSGVFPKKLIKTATKTSVVARADKSWTHAHRHLVGKLSDHTETEPLLVLNGVKLYHLDQLLINVPIKRSTLMERLRSVAKREFTIEKLSKVK